MRTAAGTTLQALRVWLDRSLRSTECASSSTHTHRLKSAISNLDHCTLTANQSLGPSKLSMMHIASSEPRLCAVSTPTLSERASPQLLVSPYNRLWTSLTAPPPPAPPPPPLSRWGMSRRRPHWQQEPHTGRRPSTALAWPAWYHAGDLPPDVLSLGRIPGNTDMTCEAADGNPSTSRVAQ